VAFITVTADIEHALTRHVTASHALVVEREGGVMGEFGLNTMAQKHF
jgi:hypothetical protein